MCMRPRFFLSVTSPYESGPQSRAALPAQAMARPYCNPMKSSA